MKLNSGYNTSYQIMFTQGLHATKTTIDSNTVMSYSPHKGTLLISSANIGDNKIDRIYLQIIQ